MWSILESFAPSERRKVSGRHEIFRLAGELADRLLISHLHTPLHDKF